MTKDEREIIENARELSLALHDRTGYSSVREIIDNLDKALGGKTSDHTQELSPNHPAMGNLSKEEFDESGYDGPMVK